MATAVSPMQIDTFQNIQYSMVFTYYILLIFDLHKKETFYHYTHFSTQCNEIATT